ncbi:hypothetical protein LTR67_008297 [Exophiala xenobiotica]
MAEIVGVVAASLELGKFVLELKQIASSIKHAPEELHEMLEDLDRTNNILRMLTELDELLAIYALPAVIQECRDSCKKYVDIARPVCVELLKTIKRSKLRGSLKSVLKENLLEKARRRIESAKSSLQLAQTAALLSCGESATTRKYPDIDYLNLLGHAGTPIRQSSSSRRSHPWSPINSDSNIIFGCGRRCKTSGCHFHTTKTKSSLSTATDYFHIDFAKFVARKEGRLSENTSVWGTILWHKDLQYCPMAFTDLRSRRGWQRRCYTKTFQDKHASIYDRDKFGRTLLHIACGVGQLSSMRLLLEQGADPNEEDFHELTSAYRFRCASSTAIRMLAGYHDLEDLPDSTVRTLSISAADYIPVIMPILEPAWSNLDLATRLEVAYGYCLPNSLARYFWLFLPQQDLSVACLTMPESTTGEMCAPFSSLALCLAYTMGRTCIDLGGWRSVLQRMVSLDGLKTPFEHGCTSPMLTYLGFTFPKLSLLGFGLRLLNWDPSMADLTHGRLTCKLRNWAHEVRLAGQDLQAYGRWEQELLSNMNREFLLYRYDSITVRLINFEFGPSPQDWQIWVATSMDESTGEFWEAVEDEEPVLDIPGSWPILDPEEEGYRMLVGRAHHYLSRRRRRRFLRYLGLGLEDESDVFENLIEQLVNYGKEKKALSRQYYLGNNISPSCREFVS